MSHDERPAAAVRDTDDVSPETEPLSAVRIAELARSLAHPARVHIVQQFQPGQSRTVTEIVAEMDAQGSLDSSGTPTTEVRLISVEILTA